MSWRWDDDAYDAAESHGQHVEGSLDWYDSWDGPEVRAHRILADHVDRVITSLSNRAAGAQRTLHDVNDRSSRSDASACVICDDLGCEFCGAAA